MTIIETIKAQQLAARKARNAEAASSLTTLIGEAEAVGKNAGNRAPTDAEVTALVKKFVKNVEDTACAALDRGLTERVALLEQERILYMSFLPTQMTEAEVAAAVAAIVAEVGPKIGIVMKLLKERHEGTYDGAKASAIVKAAVAQ